MSSRLSPEDQQKVEQYLASPLHQVERAPFRPWFLMFVLLAVVIGLGLLSRLLSYLAWSRPVEPRSRRPPHGIPTMRYPHVPSHRDRRRRRRRAGARHPSRPHPG